MMGDGSSPSSQQSRGVPASPSQLKTVLGAAGIRLKKSLGQHYLADANLRNALVVDADVRPGDIALEVGVGLGVLSDGLLRAGAHVLGVDLDARILEVARGLLTAHSVEVGEEATWVEPWLAGEERRLALVEMDAMHRKDLAPQLATLLGSVRRAAPERRLRLLANLPYNIASPLIIACLEWSPDGADGGDTSGDMSPRGIDGIGVMVQREVAERIVAKPGTAAYGALSILTQAHAELRISRIIPPSVFVPPPNVESAFVIGTRLPRESTHPFGLDASGFARFKDLVHAAFQYRRKTISKAFKLAALTPADGRTIEDALAAHDIAPSARGETLSPAEFAALANAFG